MTKKSHLPCRLCKGTGETPDRMGSGLCPRCWGRGIVPAVTRYTPGMPSGEMIAHKDGVWVRYEDFQQSLELFPPKVWVTFKGPCHREFAGVHVARPSKGAPTLVTLEGGGSDESTGTHEGDYWRDQWEAADEEVGKLREENKKLKQALGSCKESEHDARKGVADCMMCPHLGVGDPLVDQQARENEELRGTLRRVGDIIETASSLLKTTQKDT